MGTQTSEKIDLLKKGTEIQLVGGLDFRKILHGIFPAGVGKSMEAILDVEGVAPKNTSITLWEVLSKGRIDEFFGLNPAGLEEIRVLGHEVIEAFSTQLHLFVKVGNKPTLTFALATQDSEKVREDLENLSIIVVGNDSKNPAALWCKLGEFFQTHIFDPEKIHLQLLTRTNLNYDSGFR